MKFAKTFIFVLAILMSIGCFGILIAIMIGCVDPSPFFWELFPFYLIFLVLCVLWCIFYFSLVSVINAVEKNDMEIDNLKSEIKSLKELLGVKTVITPPISVSHDESTAPDSMAPELVEPAPAVVEVPARTQKVQCPQNSSHDAFED